VSPTGADWGEISARENTKVYRPTYLPNIEFHPT